MFELSSLREMTVMALQYLRGRKLRTTLTILSIVFGVLLIFAINLILPSAEDAFKRMVSNTSGTADLTVTSTSSESFDPTSALKTVAGVNGVEAVTGELQRQITVQSVGAVGAIGSAAQVEVLGIDPTTVQAVHSMIISNGRFLKPDDKGNVLLAASLADLSPDLTVGTSFPLVTASGLKTYTLVGLIANSTPASAVQIIMNLSDAQAAVNQPGLINTIEVSLHAGLDKDAVSADIQKALGDNFRVNSTTSAIDSLSALNAATTIFSLLGVFALFIGGFLIFNTFRTVVVERRHDLGMLRAIGAKQGQLTQLILIEGLIQGVIGTVLGLIAGYLFALLGVAWFGTITKGLVSTDLHFYITLNAKAVILAVVLGMLTTLVAVYFPARSVAKVSPIEALRPTSMAESQRAARWGLVSGIVVLVIAVVLLVANQQTSATGSILFLIGIILLAPSLVIPIARFFSPILSVWFAREGDLARGNLIRQPGRAAITASTLMIGLAIFVAIAAIVASFNTYVIDLVNRNFTSDLLILPPTVGLYSGMIGADESLQDQIRALPETQIVSGLRYASGEVNNQTVQILGIDPENYPKVAPLVFAQGTDASAYPKLESGRTAIVNTTLAATLKLKVGDDISVQTPDGVQPYKIVGLSNDILSIKVATIFISQDNLKTDFHKAEDVMLMIDLKPDADKKAALKDVNKILNDYPQFTAKLTNEYRATLVDITVNALNVLYILGLLIVLPAALGLLNTLTINVLERTREIGVIRAVGGSRKQVRRMVIAEALLLGLFGITLGILSGIALSYGFTIAISTIGWDIPFIFPIIGIVAALVFGIILSLLASIVPASSAAKLDIIRALQYE